MLLQFLHYELQVDTQDLHANNYALRRFRFLIIFSISLRFFFSKLLFAVDLSQKALYHSWQNTIVQHFIDLPAITGTTSHIKNIRATSVSILDILFHIRHIWDDVTSTQLCPVLFWPRDDWVLCFFFNSLLRLSLTPIQFTRCPGASSRDLSDRLLDSRSFPQGIETEESSFEQKRLFLQRPYWLKEICNISVICLPIPFLSYFFKIILHLVDFCFPLSEFV